jgi:hypothetical protein
MAAAHSYHEAAARGRAGTKPAPARLIAAHHAARGRAEARDRRIRDEDLALGGRPRLHQGNCQAMMQNEWGWW